MSSHLQTSQIKWKISCSLLKKVLETIRSRRIPEGKIGYVYVPVDTPYNLLEELSSIQGVGRYYWASKDEPWEMAGWGEADVIVADEEIYDFSYTSVIQKIANRLSYNYPTVRYYGGFKFLPLDNRGNRWKSFRAYRFVVPRIELLRTNTEMYLIINIMGGDIEYELEQINSILGALDLWIRGDTPEQTEQEPISFHHRLDCPSKTEWIELIRRTLSQIEAGVFDKVVLARETTFEANRRIDPVLLLKAMVENYSQCYRFCFNPIPERGFIGLSPERLYKRLSTYIETEALAGTIARGKEINEDEYLKSLLMNSLKERKEHEIVVNMLRTNMERLCSTYEYDEHPKIVSLPIVHHLYTHFKGILQPLVGDEEILEQLHPTPAIGGYPRGSALEWIKQEEPLDRGIYSGPVGWISYSSAEFCVGIRSALLQGDKISLYSGAGIVKGSQPEAEWNELEYKIMGYLNVLTKRNPYEKCIGEKQ
ncbi:MAG: isochorismate synthase [Candidatus Hydrogenedens sp.]